LVAAFACAIADESSGNRKCPGGYSHGTQMDIGRYWYECRDGQVVPKGCLAEDGHRVDVDATFDTKSYRMQCLVGQDGFLSVVYKACMLQGAEHDVGSQWDDGVAYFTCVKEGDNVRVITLGCVDQGKPMKLDDRVAKGDFVFSMQKIHRWYPQDEQSWLRPRRTQIQYRRNFRRTQILVHVYG